MDAIRSIWCSWRVFGHAVRDVLGHWAVVAGVILALLVALQTLVRVQEGAGAGPGMNSGAADGASALGSGASPSLEQQDPTARDRRALTEFIAKRFRVADDAVETFVAAAFRAGTEYRVDPLLVLAVAAVESRFNPVAESALGAKGLMQVLPKYHQDKLAPHGGDGALLDPEVNIDIGTRILREYLRRGGDLRSGLRLYSGSSDESLDQYAGKVLSERARMESLLTRFRRTGA